MAIYIDSKPYLRTVTTKVALPKGDPLKHGNLVFLLSNSFKEATDMIKNTTVSADGKYRYFYSDFVYRGKLYGRVYVERRLEERTKLYEAIEKSTTLMKHPKVPLSKSGYWNTFFDMTHHMEIFNRMTVNLTNIKKWITTYMDYIKSIIFREDTKGYRKILLIDGDANKLTNGALKDMIKNPAFFIYYCLYRYYDMIHTMDIDIVIYTSKGWLKVNPSKCTDKDYTTYKRELHRLMNGISKVNLESLSEDKLAKEEIETNAAAALKEKYNFLGDAETLPEKPAKKTAEAPKKTVTVKTEIKPVTKRIEKPLPLDSGDMDTASQIAQVKIDNAVSDISQSIMGEVDTADPIDDSLAGDVIADTAESELEEDEEMVSAMYNAAIAHKVKTSAACSARDAELRKQEGNVKVKGMKLSDIQKISATDVPIPVTHLADKLHTTNKNMANTKCANFEKVYNETTLNKDITSVFTCLGDKQIPMHVIDMTVTDTSDPLNYKETWRVVLEDVNRQRHTITVDIPKFVDDKFLYLGGNKKTITKQNFLYPIVKTGPDTVQIVSNYNKMFIRRQGSKSFSNVERLIKLASKNPKVAACFSMGNAFNLNSGRISTIEFDELSKTFYQFQNGNTIIYFSRDKCDANVKVTVPDGHMCIGTSNGKPIFIDVSKQTTDDGKTIIDIIVDSLGEEERNSYNSTDVGKRLLFNTATIMAQSIPLVALLGYWEGITKVMNKAHIDFTLSDKRPPASPEIAVVRFSDCYLSYKNTVETQLLMNGILVFDTKNYTFADFDDQLPYIEYFRKVYGKAAIIYALTNAYEFLIDPITAEILRDLKLPEDIVSLCIHANNLLADNDFTSEGKEWLYRVRSNEIIPAILYACVSQHYTTFRNSGGKHKLSVPRDAVIKQLLALQTVEDYSVLNPVVEAYKTNIISDKGFRGANLAETYNEEKRSFDPSMTGIMAMSTSPDANCGINRELTWEPTINNVRGYVECKDPKDLNDTNLFSVSELVTTLGCTRDDPIRTAMAGKQTRHVVPTKDAMPVLISNGADEAIKYKLASDFIVNADEDGEVIERNETNHIMVVRYKSGTCRAIDLSSHIVKNGAGGFYLANQLVSDYKVGDKFKQNDTLAYHKDYFKSDPLNGIRMTVGPLVKVAIMSSYNTYQDGSICTDSLSERLGTAIVFPDTAIIGKNSNIEYMAKIGDHVEVGDSLIQFDESFEDNELNKFLKGLEADQVAAINENSRNNVKASHPGTIVDIKIYATSELEEMSESLQKVVGKYYKGIMDKKAMLNKYDKNDSVVKCGMLFTETTGKVTPNAFGVIKGHKVEDGAILVEFYIEHGDKLKVGDKAVMFTANKVVIDELVQKGYEPYSSYRPDEEVSLLMSESAILKRMVPSVVISLLGNKVLVELKRHLKDIYDS